MTVLQNLSVVLTCWQVLLTTFGVAWPVSFLSGSYNDEDRHFHLDISFFFLFLIWRKKRTRTKQRLSHNCACTGIPSYVRNYRSPTASQTMIIGAGIQFKSIIVHISNSKTPHT